MPCGICRKDGHNRRTCRRNSVPISIPTPKVKVVKKKRRESMPLESKWNQEEPTLNILGMNTDWTNRHPSISTQDDLINHLVDKSNGSNMHLGVFSELGKTSSTNLIERFKGNGFNTKLAYDHIALVWSSSFEVSSLIQSKKSNSFIGEYVVSDIGKYAGVVLELPNRNRVGFLGVHSYKQKQKRLNGYNLMNKWIESVDDLDEVVIAGDFNGSKKEISSIIQGKYAFDDSQHTTKAQNSLDNIIVQTYDYQNTCVDYSTELFSHYPIQAEVSLEEQSCL